MLEPLKWRLPAAYRTQEHLSAMSWDAQFYLACQHCGWEQRFDIAFVSVAGSGGDYPCRRCKNRGLELVRHLERREYRCQDCQSTHQVETTGFEEMQCPTCLSRRLQLLPSIITPPFPPRFGQGLAAKDRPWGESVAEDFQYLAYISHLENRIKRRHGGN